MYQILPWSCFLVLIMIEVGFEMQLVIIIVRLNEYIWEQSKGNVLEFAFYLRRRRFMSAHCYPNLETVTFFGKLMKCSWLLHKSEIMKRRLTVKCAVISHPSLFMHSPLFNTNFHFSLYYKYNVTTHCTVLLQYITNYWTFTSFQDVMVTH